MNPSPATPAERFERPSADLYLPALDGLRFLAFLPVLIHHLPMPPTGAVMAFMSQRGWIGVELFFVISAYLFFRLLSAEQAATGRIDVPHFYVRRLLRLYPLMVIFPVLMLFLFAEPGAAVVGRTLGVAFFVDNFLAYQDYNAVPYTPHLWTLSYEFQIYLVIPLAFAVFSMLGPRRFGWLLLVAAIVCAGARAAFVLTDANYRVVWVTPFLRPESTLLGIALALGMLRVSQPAILGMAAAATVAFVFVPDVTEVDLWTLALYPICAVICGGVLYLAVSNRRFAAFLSLGPLVFLGRISFGLYVFHLLAIGMVNRGLAELQIRAGAEWLNYAGRFAAVLALTVGMATASYFLLERPFLTWKLRFSAVASRPV